MWRITAGILIGLGLLFWAGGAILAAVAPIAPTPDERVAPEEKAPPPPAEKPVPKLPPVPAEKAPPSELEKPAETAPPDEVEKPAEKAPPAEVEKPAEKAPPIKIEKPAEKAPPIEIEIPTEKAPPVKKPAEKAPPLEIEKPIEKLPPVFPTEKPVEKAPPIRIERPAEKLPPLPTEKPAEKAPVTTPKKPVVKPAEKAPPAAKPEEVATPPVPAEKPEMKPEEVQKEAAEAQAEPEEGTDLRGMNEVALAEEVARTRKNYEKALSGLKAYYASRGNASKTAWADQELTALTKVPKQQYLTIQEIAGPELKPSRDVPAANQLLTEGMQYKNYPAFPPDKKNYLKTALDKFETIIQKYPDSNKIAEAAFRMGEIYGGWYFQDYARAVQCYERCWQWDPRTPLPAMFKTAKIYEENLSNRIKAVELYNRVMAESPDLDLQKQARERIKALTGK